MKKIIAILILAFAVQGVANAQIGRLLNKAKETGKIISFDDKYIIVEYKNRTVKAQLNAFDKGILKYENADLQNKANEIIEEAKNGSDLILSEMKEHKDAKIHEVLQIRSKLNDLVEEEEKEETNEVFHVNDSVLIKKYNY